MAVSVALMFGRLGSIVGSSAVGLLLDVNCTATFYLYTCFIIGKYDTEQTHFLLHKLNIELYLFRDKIIELNFIITFFFVSKKLQSFITGCALLASFLPCR